jgi:hypothetical protein
MGGSLRVWLALLRRYGMPDAAYWARTALVTASTIALGPVRAAQRAAMRRHIESCHLDGGPIFVIGHWRSGTTLLHNLLSLDERFGFVSTAQTLWPHVILLARGPLTGALRAVIPSTRMMDNMDISPEGPQEEEIALSQLTPNAYYHALYYPRYMTEIFRRSVLFEGISGREIIDWRQAYIRTLKTATLLHAGKRLVLKNPANTARLPELMPIFPEARFIHVFRNPYVVLPSTLHFYKKTLPITMLQRIDEEALEANIYTIYRWMMERYFATRDAVPPGRLCEVRFETFEADPMGELARVYDELGLDGFDRAAPRMAAYLKQKKDYRKNEYALDDATIRAVQEYCATALDRWGYTVPGAV